MQSPYRFSAYLLSVSLSTHLFFIVASFRRFLHSHIHVCSLSCGRSKQFFISFYLISSTISLYFMLISISFNLMLIYHILFYNKFSFYFLVYYIFSCILSRTSFPNLLASNYNPGVDVS